MKKFCIIANREKDTDLSVTNQIMDVIKENNCSVVVAEQAATNDHFTDVATIPSDTECVIVIGGDGTIINAAHDLLYTDIPILGINLGTLGFLAEIELHSIKDAMLDLIHGEYVVEERMMFETSYQSLPKTEKDTESYYALNDVVIARSGFSRIIGVGIYVNNSWVQDYRGDGVIISTPTGSTGYSLSAGGPIVTPESKAIIITPICPHSFNGRSIVVSGEDTVEIRIRESKKTQEEEVIVTFDGDKAFNLAANDKIVIKKSNLTTKLIRFQRQSFFDLLRTKLREVN